ncbi:MAG TPA: group I intron-associated PD-(D/E)XK endonuclease [Solirubrobacteraceae bacterium]|nr:group I intron-associated PD-(D/E)XK endonuclease [Solirubrobacteraceae bacterium]
MAAAAIRARLVVLRPLCEGGRYDLVFDTGSHLLRVQCKWATLQGGVLMVMCRTSRHTPGGYVRTTYAADEIDALGAYVAETGDCYLIPAAEVAGRTMLSLRIAPARNGQSRKIRWAHEYELTRSLRQNWGVPVA